jgi:hypothetical protein
VKATAFGIRDSNFHRFRSLEDMSCTRFFPLFPFLCTCSHAPCPNPGTTQTGSDSDLHKNNAASGSPQCHAPSSSALPHLFPARLVSLTLLSISRHPICARPCLPCACSLRTCVLHLIRQKVNTKTSRADCLALAKLAEQAERWDGAHKIPLAFTIV